MPTKSTTIDSVSLSGHSDIRSFLRVQICNRGIDLLYMRHFIIFESGGGVV